MHPHDFAGVANGNIESVDLVACQFRCEPFLLTNQHHRNLPAAGSHDRPGHFGTGGVISTHSVDGNDNAFVQLESPLLVRRHDILALVGTAGRAGTMRLLRLFALRAN